MVGEIGSLQPQMQAEFELHFSLHSLRWNSLSSSFVLFLKVI